MRRRTVVYKILMEIMGRQEYDVETCVKEIAKYISRNVDNKLYCDGVLTDFGCIDSDIRSTIMCDLKEVMDEFRWGGIPLESFEVKKKLMD
jgi:hypothetical protein